MTFDLNSVDSQGVGDSLREVVEYQDQISQIPVNVESVPAPELELPELDLPQPIELSLPDGADPETKAALEQVVVRVNQTIDALRQVVGEKVLGPLQEAIRDQHERIAALSSFLTARQEIPLPRSPEGDFGLSAGMAAIDSELQSIRPGHLSGDGVEIIHGGGTIGLCVPEDPFADDGGVLAREVQWAKVKEDWTGAADNEVYAYPCSDINGSDVDTDTTLTLYAVTKGGDYVDYVYAKADDIVAYLPFELAGVTYGVLVNVIHGGKYYNQTALQWTQDYGVKQDSWLRTNDSTSWGSMVTVTTRVVAALDGTVMTLYGYYRYVYVDHAGQVRNIGAENQYTILAMP